jgi:HrpA-like RNA helicase
MTYGILIQELLFQPALPYSHIFLDEIHERSLEMDFTFVALKQLANRLKDKETANPKIVVMSATLNS